MVKQLGKVKQNKIKIQGGKFKNFQLLINHKYKIDKNLKPTKSLVRKFIFDYLNHNFKYNLLNNPFVDYFAGSGIIGLEAMSFGSPEIILVENNNQHQQLLKYNISRIKQRFPQEQEQLSANCHVLANLESINLQNTPEPTKLSKKTNLNLPNNSTVKSSSIWFLDPPYNKTTVSSLVQPLKIRLKYLNDKATDNIWLVETSSKIKTEKLIEELQTQVNLLSSINNTMLAAANNLKVSLIKQKQFGQTSVSVILFEKYS